MKDDYYQVDFEVGNVDHDLLIDKNGNVKRHEEEIPESDLPSAISEKLKSQYKEYRVDDVDKIESEGKVTYKVDLDSNLGDREVYFSPDGSVQP